MVVVPCARIPGDGDFVHDVEGKICVDLGLYNDLDLPFRGIGAEVVELVDALASGASGRKPVGVRVPPSALNTSVRCRRPLETRRQSLPISCARSKTPPP